MCFVNLTYKNITVYFEHKNYTMFTRLDFSKLILQAHNLQKIIIVFLDRVNLSTMHQFARFTASPKDSRALLIA
jgi:hypothetical protein